MLQLLDRYSHIIKSWHLLRYEQEGDSYMLHIVIYLRDASRLDIRDYVFADGQRKYAYHWMNADGTLRCRWDNAPHWSAIPTSPHHKHLSEGFEPEPSFTTNLEDLFAYIAESFTGD